MPLRMFSFHPVHLALGGRRHTLPGSPPKFRNILPQLVRAYSRQGIQLLDKLFDRKHLDRDPSFRNIPQLEPAAHCCLRIQLLDKPHQYNQQGRFRTFLGTALQVGQDILSLLALVTP